MTINSYNLFGLLTQLEYLFNFILMTRTLKIPFPSCLKFRTTILIKNRKRKNGWEPPFGVGKSLPLNLDDNFNRQAPPDLNEMGKQVWPAEV